jgi:uncharacterized membrane protein
MQNRDLLIKTLLIYIISMIILCKIKPSCLFNSDMTYKPWFQYMITNNIYDMITLTSVTIFFVIFSIFVANNI